MGIKKQWLSLEEFEKIQGGDWSPGPHTHVKVDIIDTPWAWADVLKTGSNLTDLATRQHAGLTDVTSDLHHPQLHAASHHVAGADLLAFASITGFGTYLDQAVKQASSPTFAGLNLTGSAFIVGENKGLVIDAGANRRVGFIKYSGREAGIWRTNAQDFEIGRVDAEVTHLPGAPISWTVDLTISATGQVIVNDLTASTLLGAGTSKELKSLTTITGLTTGHVLKATGASAIAFQANNLGGLSDITLGTPIEASLLAYNQAEAFWYAGRPEYDIRYKSYDIEWEFWTASPPAPWASGAVGGGSASGVAASSHHPGSIGAYSGGAANSGYYWIAANNNLILSGVEQADFVFKTAADWDSRMNRFGFQDSITIALPTDGAYFNLNGRNITGVTRKAGVQSTTGTSYNTSANIWYRGRIVVNSGATQVTFFLYDASGNQLWTNTLATNIPTAATGFGVVSYYTAVAAGTHTITMDLAYLVCARGLVR